MTGRKQKVSVLFVCLGNICRSPTAQAMFDHLVAEQGGPTGLVTDSAGTHAYHVGEPPDRRAQAAARERGIDMSRQRARAISSKDFTRFDLILAMDHDNLRHLEGRAPADQRHRVRLLMEFAPEGSGEIVPDPYYGGSNGFVQVLDLVEVAGRGLLAHVDSLLRETTKET